MENSHRIKCVAYDRTFFTEPGQLPRPKSFPDNSKIAWTTWDWKHHCIIAAWAHETFDELVPFAQPGVAPFEMIKEASCLTQ